MSTDDDEIAEDAIMVGIGGTSANMLGIGLSYVQPMGTIYRTARVTEKGVFDAGGETGWWTVRDALAQAHVVQQRMAYERVFMTMADVGIWRPEWGSWPSGRVSDVRTLHQ
ncbi:MAG: hypothetical protein RLW68_15600 [Devosia marina]|uniref:hypothetical protein n=1 Tax=Devosia marina TaxID=2683198 RepID=UPI0032EECF4E